MNNVIILLIYHIWSLIDESIRQLLNLLSEIMEISTILICNFIQEAIQILKLEMQQISVDVNEVSNNRFKNNQKINFIDGLTECFSEYLTNMFKDFGQALEKRLQSQDQKIVHNEALLRQLMNKLESRRCYQLTSLGSIQGSEESNHTSRVKSLSINSDKQPKQINQVNEALKRLQQGIEYLQASLTQLKSKKSIQDPQNNSTTQAYNTQAAESQAKGHFSTTTKIEKLASKINKFAKESSIEQIQNQTEGLVRPHRIQKTRSLINLSSRRYYPASSAKQLELAPFHHNSQLESQIQHTFNEYSHVHSNSSFYNQNSSVLFQQNTTVSQQNKMPLINKSKTVLNQLYSLVRDQADANVVLFYLKKGLKTVGQFATGKSNIQKINNLSKQGQNHQNDERKLAKKQLNHNFSEYFSVKSNALQTVNTCESQKNGTSVCSIKRTLPGSESGMSWVKENFSSINDRSQAECSLNQKLSDNKDLSQTNMSRQKRKFQRTSNDQKMMMLKAKFRPHY